MPRYIPLAPAERRAIRNLVNGTATHQDKVHAVNVLAAYDSADEFDPVAVWRQQRADDLRAIAEEWTA